MLELLPEALATRNAPRDPKHLTFHQALVQGLPNTWCSCFSFIAIYISLETNCTCQTGGKQFLGVNPKMVVQPQQTHGFSGVPKNDQHLRCEMGGSHHLRKHRNMNNHVPDLDCLMIDYCIYCSSVPFKLGFGEHDLIQIFWGRDLALTKSSILWYVAPFSSTKSWNYHLLVVFHQPLWKICASQNGWNSPPIFGVKISKIFELPPPRHDAT